jgi:outer membrane protein TolC
MKSVLLTGLVIFAGIVLQAQNVLELSLQEAQTFALQNNLQMRSSAIDLEIARKKIKETTAIGLPQINASGSFQNFLDIPVTVIPDFISPTVLATLLETEVIEPEDVPEGDPQFVEAQFGTKYNVSAGINASQLVFDGSYIVGLQAARAYAHFAELGVESTEADVKEQVAQAYSTVLVAEKNVSLLASTVIPLRKIYEETKVLFDNGFAEQQDVDQLQLQLASVENQMDFSKNQLEIAKEVLCFSLGVPETTEIKLKDTVESLVNPAWLGDLVQQPFVPEMLPTYKKVESGIGLQQLLVRKEKAAYLPSLSAFFSHNQNALRNEFNFFDGDKDWFPSTVWGVNLSIPIFSSGMKHYKIQQAELELEKARIGLEQVEDASRLAYRSAKADLLFAMNQLKNSEENLALSDRILSHARIKYKEGLAGSFELSQAETQQLSTQGAYIATMLNVLQAKIKLQKSTNKF